MFDLQFFTDCLFLALHLTPHAISFASDFSLWFTNRFHIDSDMHPWTTNGNLTLTRYRPISCTHSKAWPHPPEGNHDPHLWV